MSLIVFIFIIWVIALFYHAFECLKFFIQTYVAEQFEQCSKREEPVEKEEDDRVAEIVKKVLNLM